MSGFWVWVIAALVAGTPLEEWVEMQQVAAAAARCVQGAEHIR